jgi:hypothetical protein
VVFILFFWVVWLVRRERVEIHTDGLRWCQAGKIGTALWSDIKGYVIVDDADTTDLGVLLFNRNITLNRKARFSGSDQRLKLEIRGNRHLSLKWNYARSGRLINYLIDTIDARVLADAHVRLRHGVPAVFGSMHAHPNRTLYWGSKRIAFGDIEAWRVRDGVLDLTLRDGQKARYRLTNAWALDKLLTEWAGPARS